jgi:hypothetical protein
MSQKRFGKHPKKNDYRTLRFSKYTGTLAAPPASADVTARVYNACGSDDPKVVFPIDGNDQYGDCTIAALAHAVTVFQGQIGERKIWGAKSVEKLYFKLSGGQDTGLNELDVLNYWRKHSADGDKIVAYAAIDPKNHEHVKQAVATFRGCYIGFQVQQNAIADFDAGRPWTPGKLTNGGHAVFAIGYDEDTVSVLTWGGVQKGTWAWWDECVDEAYALLPPEAKKPDFAPGFDFATLHADLSDVTDPV